MMTACLIAILALGQQSAADAVTLRDGAIVLGQVVETQTRGRLGVIVRREWAKEHLPDRCGRWIAAEARNVKLAREQRRQRLEAWLRERPAAERDAVREWIDQELARLAKPAEPARLLAVEIDGREVRRVDRRPPDVGRTLRQAWRGGLKEPETRTADELTRELEGRGLAVGAVDPASLDALLALPVESEPRWRLRRAATEVKNDPGLRFVRYGGLVLPEEASAQAPAGGAALLGAASAVIKDLIGDPAATATDPLVAVLKGAEARGRVGVVVTQLEMTEDFRRVTVRATLLVNLGPERWQPGLSFPVTIDVKALPAGAGAPLEADPRVKAVFDLVGALGLGGGAAGDLKAKGLNAGAATRIALAEARSALDREIEALALPINR